MGGIGTGKTPKGTAPQTLNAAFQGEMCPEVLECPLVIQQFEAVVDQHGDRRCLVHEGRSMSYRDVNVAANKMARLLQGLGVSRGDRVAVWQDRGFELVISMLACLKAQATFVLCDPSYPAERLGIYVEDSAATMIVTQGRNLEPARAAAARLPARPHVFDLGQLPHASKSESGANLGLLSDPEDLAYVFSFSSCRHRHSECGRGYSCLAACAAATPVMGNT